MAEGISPFFKQYSDDKWYRQQYLALNQGDVNAMDDYLSHCDALGASQTIQ